MGFTSSGQVENSGTGTIVALAGAVTLTIPTSASAALNITGTWVATLIFEATVDGTDWFPVPATLISSGAQITTLAANGAILAGVGGYQGFRVRASAYTSGTVSITWNSDNTPNISATVQQGSAPWSISGTVAATQSGTWNVNNVSGTVSLPTGASTETTLGTRLADATFTGRINTLGQKTMANSTPVVLASDQTVIPVSQSGTWTTVPSNDLLSTSGTITALDTGTSNLTGANGQVFYFGTPTINSAVIFSATSLDSISLQANILGGGGTLVVDVSMDGGSFWFRPNVYQVSTQSYSNAFTAPFFAIANVAGMTHVRVRSITSWSGTATIIARGTTNGRAVTIADALPTGANTIGSLVNISGVISLPTGASTAANQATANASLSSIDAGIPTTLGQTTMAASMPVVLASDQTSIPVAQSGTWNVNNVSGTVSLPTGAATSANQTTEITALQLIDNPIGSVGAGTAGTSSMLSGAVYNTTLPTLTTGQQAAVQADSSGRLLVSSTVVDGSKTTYSAVFTGLITAALSTDIFTVSGSSTKTVRVIEIGLSATAAADTKVNAVMIKRSAANTGGTSTTATAVPHDSTNAAATAVVRGYTVNPTALGAAVGTLRTTKFDAIGTSTVVPMVPIFDFGTRPGQAIVLRGSAEFLCLNLSGTTVSTPSFDIWIEWTEE